MVDIIDAYPAVPEPAPAHPDPSSIPRDAWRRFESAALGILYTIQPSATSEHLRAAIIDYVQRLLASHSGVQVKLVKCVVQNIIVDISVNQIGGLCTLCFLEKVDENFGKKHLFKRSVMLIKDWCYYETRILGAHHGLISTYALEILVLYIFHIFHKSLNGPLAVLYRFLDYYSQFDWDAKGISLFGPVSLSSLPDLVTDPPVIHDDGFLLREKFLRECADAFSVPPRNSEKDAQLFSRKFLNIVDPLKQSNNLGRSVSRGNFYRIRSAFDFGARKLGKILQRPVCYTVDEVNQFFGNTLKRNRIGFRQDVLVSSSDDGTLTYHATNGSLSLGLDCKRVNNCSAPLYSNPCGDFSYRFNNINISDSINHDDSIKQKQCNSIAGEKAIKSISDGLLDSEGSSHASTDDSVSVRNSGDFYEALTTISPSGRRYAPHQFYQLENGKVVVRHNTNMSHHGMPTKQFTSRSYHSFEDAKYHNEFSGSFLPPIEHNAYSSAGFVNVLATSNSACTHENSQLGGANNNILKDLTGDFETYFHNLQYAQGFQQDNPVNPFSSGRPAPPSLQCQNTCPSNGRGRKNPYSYASMNGAVPCPPYPSGYLVWSPFIQPDDPMAMRTRGTGTYFSDRKLRKNRPPTGRVERGRNQFASNNYQRFHHHVRTDMPADMGSGLELRHELPQIHIPGATDHGMPSPMSIPMSSSSLNSPRDQLKVPAHSPSSQVRRNNFHGNGFMLLQDSKLESRTFNSKLESGILGPLPLEVTSKDHASRSESASSNQVSGPVSTVSAPRNTTTTDSNLMRDGAQSYRLKDSRDFPPLSS
ncbi:PAP/OAS1 substrate-binding domain superfamily [Zea mays]|uniref:PAP/OAS1 substrate-binding domain superfamily n=1 Tax=Zea mays TaxID=4577 RepID=A0A1D6NQR1_MAIZE|nr:PAP/OAS1 substrate-binding domain superfamily [Zea mays]